MVEAMPSRGLIDALAALRHWLRLSKIVHYPMDNVFIHMLSAKSTGVNDKVARSRELALVAMEG
jgi:hypothetical protein